MLEAVDVEIGGERVLAVDSWQVHTGDWWLLTGARGSGKSSLLALLYAQAQASSGMAWVLETNLRQATPHTVAALRQQLGLILPQRLAWLPDLSLQEQLRLHLRAAQGGSTINHEERIAHVLQWAELDDSKNHTPPAHNKDKYALQMQLARALLLLPKIILLDDAFIHQQDEATQWLHTRLRAWQNNQPCAIIVAQSSGAWQQFSPTHAQEARCEDNRLRL